MTSSSRGVVVLGGAGFIGSHIVEQFVETGSAVTVIDGLLPRTGGRREHLAPIAGKIQFIEAEVGQISNLRLLLRGCDAVIDCMAWTSHVCAIHDPLYDLRLNCESHLHMLRHLEDDGQSVVFLGSRGQYGRPSVPVITEDTAMVPEDIQGIHKVAAESYFRLRARRGGLKIVSLRLPNCFGERAPISGEDIGLVGGFIRALLSKGRIEVFGRQRSRSVAYVRDVASVVHRLCVVSHPGFAAVNMGGHEVLVEDLARLLIEMTGSGELVLRALPEEIASLDGGPSKFSDEGLRRMLGEIPSTDLRSALSATVAYFRAHMT